MSKLGQGLFYIYTPYILFVAILSAAYFSCYTVGARDAAREDERKVKRVT